MPTRDPATPLTRPSEVLDPHPDLGLDFDDRLPTEEQELETFSWSQFVAERRWHAIERPWLADV